MSDEPTIVDLAPGERDSLDSILEESFEGLYLWHARKMLREIELVRAAKVGGEFVGLVMLKKLNDEVGYLYYLAVAANHRRRGVGGVLLRNALDYFVSIGSREAYASIEEENDESAALFVSMGFRRTSYDELSRKYGKIRALDMYRRMLVVPGEILYCKS